MTKQEKTALNMAKFIKEQSLLLLDKLNEINDLSKMIERWL